MLHEIKNFLSSHFDMKDLCEASYVLGIEINRDRTKGVTSTRWVFLTSLPKVD